MLSMFVNLPPDLTSFVMYHWLFINNAKKDQANLMVTSLSAPGLEHALFRSRIAGTHLISSSGFDG
jgi:hypothetical protein